MYDIDYVCPAPPIHTHQLNFCVCKRCKWKTTINGQFTPCDIYNVNCMCTCIYLFPVYVANKHFDLILTDIPSQAKPLLDENTSAVVTYLAMP